MAKVRTRKRGKTYSYIFEAGQQDGRRKVIEKGGFPTKEAAYDAGVAAYTDWKHGNIGIMSEKITLQDFLTRWLENVARLNVRESSFNLYSNTIRKQIAPYIGSSILQELTPAMLDGYMRKLVNKGFAKSTISLTWRVLHQALDYAVYPAELIQSNPTSYIKVPRSAPTGIIKRTIISQEKYLEIMNRCPFGSLPHIPIAILYHTGMRIGEALAVCWDDVDFKRKTIRVHRQYIYLSKKGNAFVPPKTASSIRCIPVDDALIKLLARWRDQQQENERMRGDSYCIVDEQEDHSVLVYSKGLRHPSNRQYMVCTNVNGRPVSRMTVMKKLRSEGLNSHSFRHSHATLLVEAGAPLKGVAGRLGHKQIEITDSIYTHNTEKMQRDTADIFAKSMQTSS